jgi:hypothetical protein
MGYFRKPVLHPLMGLEVGVGGGDEMGRGARVKVLGAGLAGVSSGAVTGRAGYSAIVLAV